MIVYIIGSEKSRERNSLNETKELKYVSGNPKWQEHHRKIMDIIGLNFDEHDVTVVVIENNKNEIVIMDSISKRVEFKPKTFFCNKSCS